MGRDVRPDGRPRILLSAFACGPGHGSEPAVGWGCALALAARAEVHVLTTVEHRAAIESEAASGRLPPSLHFHFFAFPGAAWWWRRGRLRGIQLYYPLWQFFVARHARRRLNLKRFDWIHHITFGRYWVPSFLRRSESDPPLVFGPVGGGDETPPAFRGSYSFAGRLRERAKRCAERFFTFAFRRRYRLVSVAVAATEETASKLRRLVRCPVSVFPQSALSDDELSALRALAAETPVSATPLFVVACRLIHWKAVDLAVRAMPAVLRALPGARLEIIGEGPEDGRLRRLVRDLRLDDCVRFVGRYPTQAELHRKIASATALVHPALHESFGQVCLEALALGTPVACWKHGGPGVVAAGQPIAPVALPEDPSDVAGLAAAMVRAFRSRASFFPPDLVWSRWVGQMEKIVSAACGGERSRHE